jgi:hypothetical protein
MKQKLNIHNKTQKMVCLFLVLMLMLWTLLVLGNTAAKVSDHEAEMTIEEWPSRREYPEAEPAPDSVMTEDTFKGEYSGTEPAPDSGESPEEQETGAPDDHDSQTEEADPDTEQVEEERSEKERTEETHAEDEMPVNAPTGSRGDYVIQIGDGALQNGTYNGFTISDTSPYRIITFDSGANLNTYRFEQTGSSQFRFIKFDKDVDTTVVLGSINAQINSTLASGTNLTLLLEGSNIINGYIHAPAGSTLTIDSAEFPGEGSESGSIMITNSDGLYYAGIGGGYGGSDSGAIIIKGGTLFVSQSGSPDVAGAAIGGGPQGIGTVAITGGKVNATVSGASRGAAIGGGSTRRGTVTITGGTVNAETLDSSTGAAIGGGYGNDGTVTITGGIVNATASMYTSGAAIGGGACSTNGGAGYVTITGGIITAISGNGAAIGNGSGSAGGGAGYITIKEATITTYSYTGPGVGCNSTSVKPTIDICHSADITMIGKAQYNIRSGINCNDYNKGDGYFVNLFNWTSEGDALSASQVLVLNTDDMSVFRIISVPSHYDYFETIAFTTGTTTPMNYRVFLNTGSGLRELNRIDNYFHNYSFPIHSVYKMNGYRVHEYIDPSEYIDRDELPVVLKKGYADYWMVTEKYVDINGNPIAGKKDTITLVPKNGSYDKTIPAIPGYISKGYNWTNPPSNGSGYLSGPPPSKTITQDETIYFVYAPDPGTADITVGKKVTGPFANKIKSFTFIVRLLDSDNNPLTGIILDCESGIYPGSTAESPLYKMLELDNEGKAAFSLKHEQTLTIKGLPADVYIWIEEDTTDIYTTRITDSEDPTSPFISRVVERTVGRMPTQTIDYENDRTVVVPTAIDEGQQAMWALMLFAALAILAGWVTIGLTKRRSRAMHVWR